MHSQDSIEEIINSHQYLVEEIVKNFFSIDEQNWRLKALSFSLADAHQEGLMALWRAAISWDDRGAPFVVYAKKCIENAFINIAVKARRRKTILKNKSIEQVKVSADVSESVFDFQPFVDQLSPRQRECVVAHFYEGKRVKEIAQEFNISEDAVESCLRRAIASLRRMIEKSGEEIPNISNVKLK
jgi:RNA polymerase sigma factor (sigma-70 family)